MDAWSLMSYPLGNLQGWILVIFKAWTPGGLGHGDHPTLQLSNSSAKLSPP